MRTFGVLLLNALLLSSLTAQEVPDKIAFLKFLEERTKTLDIYDQDGGWLDTKRVTELDSLGLSFNYKSCSKTEWDEPRPIIKNEFQPIVLSPLGEGTYKSRVTADFDAIFYNEITGETVSWPVEVSFKRIGDEFKILSIHETINGLHWSKTKGYWHRPSAFKAYRLSKKYKEQLNCYENVSEFEDEPWGYRFPEIGNVNHFFVQNPDGSLKFISDTISIRIAVKDETEGFDESRNYEIKEDRIIGRFVYSDGEITDPLKIHYVEDGAGLKIDRILNGNKEFYWHRSNGLWSNVPMLVSLIDPNGHSLQKAFELFLDTAKLQDSPETVYEFQRWSQEVTGYDGDGNIIDQGTMKRQAFPIADVKVEFRNSKVYFPIQSYSETGQLELFTLIFIRSAKGFSIVKAYDELGREVKLN